MSFAPSLLCPKPPQPPRRKESLFKSIGRASETKFEWHFGWTERRADHRLLNVTIRPEMRGRRRSDRHQMMGETEKAPRPCPSAFSIAPSSSSSRDGWMDGDALFPRLLSPSIILRNGPPCCSEYLPEGEKQGGTACFSIPGVEEPLGPTNYTTKES